MDSYTGEIRLFGGNRIPENWLICAGQSLPVKEYSELYSVIGNIYGGSISAFNLPDLRGRVPIGMGQGPDLSRRNIGQAVGSEKHTLKPEEATHTHGLKVCIKAAAFNNPTGQLLGTSTGGANAYYGGAMTNPKTLHAASITSVVAAGGEAAAGMATGAHENMMPSRAMNFIICVHGIYPDRG